MPYERSPAYRPGQTEPYKLSRSRIENFIRCPRCFWLAQRLKIDQPSTPPFLDYKATAKDKEITDLDPPGGWHDSYRRQMEVYQWLLRGEGHKVCDTGYFVYANGISKADGFFNKVEFRTNIFPYEGSDKWVEPTLLKIKKTLEGDMPKENPACEYCAYARSRTQLTLDAIAKKK
jgi:CRISPR/Cas system-associated exonuclease Cas4 (RecB family)